MATTQAENLLTTARDFFMQYGIKSVSMDDLSSKMGISKKTLYQTVENKEDLVMKVIENHIDIQHKEMERILSQKKDAIEEMLMFARYIIDLLKNLKPGVTYDLQKYYPASWKKIEMLHQQTIDKIILKNIKKGIKEGVYRKNVNPEIISKLYLAQALQISSEKLFPQSDFKMEDLIREFIAYHFYGIASLDGFKRLNKIKKI